MFFFFFFFLIPSLNEEKDCCLCEEKGKGEEGGIMLFFHFLEKLFWGFANFVLARYSLVFGGWCHSSFIIFSLYLVLLEL